MEALNELVQAGKVRAGCVRHVRLSVLQYAAVRA